MQSFSGVEWKINRTFWICFFMGWSPLCLQSPVLAVGPTRGILVVGGSGRLGRLICSKLVSEQKFDVVSVLVRNETAAREIPELRGCQLLVGDVSDGDSLTRAVSPLPEGSYTIIDVHGVKPPRLSKPSDLMGGQEKGLDHPAQVNLRGVKNLLLLMTSTNRFRKIVRVTGALVGRPSNIFAILFNLLLSFSNKYHQLSEIAIRESGVDYAVIRPTGIRMEPRARETGRRLICEPSNGKSVPVPGKISAEDLSDLCLLAADSAYISRSTLVVSTAEEDKLPKSLSTWTSWSDAIKSGVFIRNREDEITLAPHRLYATLFMAFFSSIVTLIAGFIITLVSHLFRGTGIFKTF